MVWLMRDLDNKVLGQNKVLCSCLEFKLPIVNYHAGFPALPASERQISGYPPASGARTALTWIASSLSPHLTHFLARLVGHPHFRFVESWIIGLAIGGAEFRGADIAVNFSE